MRAPPEGSAILDDMWVPPAAVARGATLCLPPKGRLLYDDSPATSASTAARCAARRWNYQFQPSAGAVQEPSWFETFSQCCRAAGRCPRAQPLAASWVGAITKVRGVAGSVSLHGPRPPLGGQNLSVAPLGEWGGRIGSLRRNARGAEQRGGWWAVAVQMGR
jgi:hypothetical protein